MLVDDEELLARIKFGEDSLLEFKQVIVADGRVKSPDGGSMSDEMAAMANSASGGIVVVGVGDSGEVMGFSREQIPVVETWLRSVCNDSIVPPVDCTIRIVPIRRRKADRALIRVNKPSSLFVHKSRNGYYRRVGSSKREIPPESLARLFQQRSQSRIICFDEQIVASAPRDALVRSLFDRLRTVLSPADDAEFLRKLHLLVRGEDGEEHPTVAGLLTASENPERYLPSAFIQAVCYRGEMRDADQQLDARDIVGPIDRQIAEACAFVERNMKVSAIKVPGRIDIPQYSLHAVFEAIVNAVVHRDYSIRGAKIRLHMFSDRLELSSPGGLPNSLKLDEIQHRQFARNELICSLLSKLKVRDAFPGRIAEVLLEAGRTNILDRRGEGVPIIIEKGRRNDNKEIEYRLFGDSELLLTIYASSASSLKVTEKVTEKSLVLKDRIQAAIAESPNLSQRELAEMFGVNRAYLARVMSAMQRNGLIRRIGPDKGGYWEVGG